MLPGVFLLSLWRRSGFPVLTAILFGPGLIPISVQILAITYSLFPDSSVHARFFTQVQWSPDVDYSRIGISGLTGTNGPSTVKIRVLSLCA